MHRVLLTSILALSSITALAANTAAILPPLPKWEGKSRALVAPANDPWITPSEKSALRATPSYAETIAWLKKLDDASPAVQMVTIGRTAGGYDIWMVIASSEGAFTAEKIRASQRPTVLAQAGIHGGEIDGKDAGMMLLRDITVRGNKRELLDNANVLFVPILNVDGHERASRFARINQRGPEVMGWRTNAQNLNLNRDYTKLETTEVQAIVRVINEYDPDLYFDLHVTDGADYQYDVTFGGVGTFGHSPSGAKWMEEIYTPAVSTALKAMGHVPGLLAVATFDPKNPHAGIYDWPPGARLSNPYGDARHLPTILVENHSLKPYDRRVLGTYVLLETTMRLLGREAGSLRAAIDTDRARRVEVLPLAWETSRTGDPVEFLGIEAEVKPSEISGDLQERYTGNHYSMKLPYRRGMNVIASVKAPVAWWIPLAWSHIAEKLKMHGIRVEQIDTPRELEVEMYRFSDAKLDASWNEGRVEVSAKAIPERRKELFPAGSFRVPTDQPLGDLAAVLLEPDSPDSFFQWGYFLSILKPTEYVESYVMEPTARQMLESDTELRRRFNEKLRDDAAFRANPDERLQWFYQQTPYYDERALLYPIARETK